MVQLVGIFSTLWITSEISPLCPVINRLMANNANKRGYKDLRIFLVDNE